MKETLHIADLTFEVRRSRRRKSLGLTVDRGGELIVHAPDSAAEDELQRWIRTKLLWVHQKLAIKQNLIAESVPPEFVSGESIFYLGRSYRLKVVASQPEPLRFDGHWFSLRSSDRNGAMQHFRKWYTDAGSQWLSKRVEMWQRNASAAPAHLSVRDLGYRWGSCGKNGNIYFNWRLLQLPVRLVDYVIAHELVHLREHNHTPEFWRELERVLPDWRERKTELETGWRSYVTFPIEMGKGEAV